MVILSVFVFFCGPLVHLIGFINFVSVFIQIAKSVYCVESRRVLRSQRLLVPFQRLLIHLRLTQLALIKVEDIKVVESGESRWMLLSFFGIVVIHHSD